MLMTFLFISRESGNKENNGALLHAFIIFAYNIIINYPLDIYNLTFVWLSFNYK